MGEVLVHLRRHNTSASTVDLRVFSVSLCVECGHSDGAAGALESACSLSYPSMLQRLVWCTLLTTDTSTRRFALCMYGLSVDGLFFDRLPPAIAVNHVRSFEGSLPGYLFSKYARVCGLGTDLLGFVGVNLKPKQSEKCECGGGWVLCIASTILLQTVAP